MHEISVSTDVEYYAFKCRIQISQGTERETYHMMTPSKGNMFHVTGFPSQRPVTQSFDVFFDLRLNKRLSKLSRRRWFETPSRPLWRHCNEIYWHERPFNIYQTESSKPMASCPGYKPTGLRNIKNDLNSLTLPHFLNAILAWGFKCQRLHILLKEQSVSSAKPNIIRTLNYCWRNLM